MVKPDGRVNAYEAGERLVRLGIVPSSIRQHAGVR